MDPDEAYEQMREALDALEREDDESGPDFADWAVRLYESVAALDQWLVKSGRLPKAWAGATAPASRSADDPIREWEVSGRALAGKYALMRELNHAKYESAVTWREAYSWMVATYRSSSYYYDSKWDVLLDIRNIGVKTLALLRAEFEARGLR